MKINEARKKLIERMKEISQEEKKCPDCGKDKINIDDNLQCQCNKIDIEGVLYED